MSANTTILIIDDEPEICNALRWLYESVNYKVETYNSAFSFLENYKSNVSGCIIIDVRMPVMSGLELLEHLKLQKNQIPVVVITGYGDIGMAVRAMKLGAVDFILKPINDQCLLDVVQKCIHQSTKINAFEINERIKQLTKREREVIDLILEGKLNKEIAYELSISMSTVEAHRANIMQKMQAKTTAHLIKLYLPHVMDMENS